jgi:hypothetical protein
MCNINIAMRKDGKPDDAINEWMTIASWNSWKSGNNHSEGYLSIGTSGVHHEKSESKIRYLNAPESYFMASHQRLKTSGAGLNNAHPHASQHFLLMHNGIFSGKGDNEKSDTKYYLKLLERCYESKKDVVEAIRESLKETGGSYSVLVMELKTGKLYYFKEQYTQMSIAQNDEWFFMSTNRDNVEVAKEMFDIKGTTQSVKSGIVYELTNNGLIKRGGFKPFRAVYNITDSGVVTFGGYGHRLLTLDDLYDDGPHQDKGNKEMFQ